MERWVREGDVCIRESGQRRVSSGLLKDVPKIDDPCGHTVKREIWIGVSSCPPSYTRLYTPVSTLCDRKEKDAPSRNKTSESDIFPQPSAPSRPLRWLVAKRVTPTTNSSESIHAVYEITRTVHSERTCVSEVFVRVGSICNRKGRGTHNWM